VLKNTETEIEFELFFKSWTIEGFSVSERKVISMKMGTNFFKVVSTFETDYKGALTVGIGITPAQKPEILTDAKKGSLTIWESYPPQNGALGTSVIAKPDAIQGFTSYEKEQFVLVNAKAGQPITYYIGAGWSKSPQFKTKQDWVNAVNQELFKF
jgi:Domain of unknown function (DUF4861)